MDPELREFLEKLSSRIDSRFDAVERRLKTLEERSEQFPTKDDVEKIETSLLTAFHGWARPMEVRVNNVTTIVMGFEERLALAEQRISELERKRAS